MCPFFFDCGMQLPQFLLEICFTGICSDEPKPLIFRLLPSQSAQFPKAPFQFFNSVACPNEFVCVLLQIGRICHLLPKLDRQSALPHIKFDHLSPHGKDAGAARRGGFRHTAPAVAARFGQGGVNPRGAPVGGTGDRVR